MIVDWAENCAKIFRTGRLSDADEFDRKRKRQQELIYLLYLINMHKMNKEQCYSEWLRLENGTASGLMDYPQSLKFAFQDTYRAALNYKTAPDYTRRLKPITIYQAEIDFLNRLMVPLWIKQYWCALLVYYKFVSQVYSDVTKDSAVDSWASRQTCYADPRYGSVCQDRIAAFQKKLSFCVIQENIRPMRSSGQKILRKPYFVPTFINEAGNRAITIASISETQSVIALCHDTLLTCPMCGALFEKHSRTQREVCPKCYPKVRRMKDAARKRKKYAENKQIGEKSSNNANH